MSDRDFADLERVAEESRLWQAACGVTDGVERAWAHSRIANAIARSTGLVRSWTGADWVRMAAMTKGWAALGYWAILSMVSPYARPAIPRPLILAVAVIAFVIAASADGLARSWPASATRLKTGGPKIRRIDFL